MLFHPQPSETRPRCCASVNKRDRLIILVRHVSMPWTVSRHLKPNYLVNVVVGKEQSLGEVAELVVVSDT